MKSATVSILASLVTLPALVLGVGFIFHTSFDGTILGKYSPRYFLLLCVWFLAVVPLAFLFGRFIFATQHIVLSGARRVAVRPRVKILVLLVGGLGLYLGFDAALQNVVARRTTTPLGDVFHPYLQNVPNPARSKAAINSAGFRGPHIKLGKRKRAFRIFVFGGSTVYNGSLRVPDTHPGRLAEKLKATYPGARVEVQNAAGDWHSSQHSVMKLLFHVQDYDPDLVIIYHAVNDLLRSRTPDEFAAGDYWPDYRHYYGAASNLVHPRRSKRQVWRLYTGCLFSDFRFDTVPVLGPDGRGINGLRMMYFPKALPVEIDEWPSLEAFDRNMREFVRIARSKNMRVLLATQPYLYRPDLNDRERALIWFPASQHEKGTKPSLASMIAGMDRFNGVTAAIAEDLDVPFVDLEPIVPKTLEYFYDDVHNTRAGNELIADAFHDAIVEHDLIPERLGSAARDR